jgi:hypothetical protein
MQSAMNASHAPRRNGNVACCAFSKQKASISAVVEGHQAASGLVPQHQAHAAEAFEQAQAVDGAEFGMLAQHVRKPVVRDTATEVMHVMNADIGREPAQEPRVGRNASCRARRLGADPTRSHPPMSCPQIDVAHRIAKPRLMTRGA